MDPGCVQCRQIVGLACFLAFLSAASSTAKQGKISRAGQSVTSSGGLDIFASDVAKHAASENEVDLSKQKPKRNYQEAVQKRTR